MASPGNIVTLGGAQKTIDNDLKLNTPETTARHIRFRWRYLNSHLQNALKVIIGFIPAFATFALTKDWWLLAYCGAFIWFGITGLRNILQSVLGGGGLRRSPLLRWNAYVSWDRIADSLLFTGFSVPLLDFVAKTVVLDNVFHINTTTQPVALYTFMALTNGIYLSSHNAFRGLPRGAVLGNFFRSILSIPIAILFNLALAEKQKNGTDTLVAPCSACYVNLARTDAYVRESDELAENVNDALGADGMHYTPGAVKVRHLLEIMIDDVGLEEIGDHVTRPLSGLKLAPYMGCLVSRPDYDDRW